MCVRDGHLPDRYVRGDTGQELAYRQGHDQTHVVLARDVGPWPNAPQPEEGPTVYGDGQQLHHSHRCRIGECVEYHLPYDIVGAAHDVPQDAESGHDQIFSGFLSHRSWFVLQVPIA